MITIEKKDYIVSDLVSSDDCTFFYSIDKGVGITDDECHMILRQLEKMGMIDIGGGLLGAPDLEITINSSLHDFHSRGGFKAQELILLTKLEKLDAEIQLLRLQLEPDKLEQLDKVVSLFSSACSMIPYVKSAFT